MKTIVILTVLIASASPATAQERSGRQIAREANQRRYRQLKRTTILSALPDG